MPQESVSFDNLLRLDELWVFGYGSLIWNPGFEYVDDFTGYIEGFSRRFWQGNVTHRGRPGKPGRVVTLIEEKGARVWGKAFHVMGANNIAHCLDHLGARECQLGGYDIQMIEFKPHRKSFNTHHCNRSNHLDTLEDVLKMRPIITLTFLALPKNELYLGPASSKAMADCLLKSEGPSGKNLDYMLGILEFLKFSVPYQEVLSFEQEILDIERNAWIQLQQEGFEMVADCHGFYSRSSVDDESSYTCMHRPTRLNTSEESSIASLHFRTFTPLLETIRLIELERNEINRDRASRSAINISSVFTKHLFTGSDDESDSGLSTSPVSIGSIFEYFDSDHSSEFSEIEDKSDSKSTS